MKILKKNKHLINSKINEYLGKKKLQNTKEYKVLIARKYTKKEILSNLKI